MRRANDLGAVRRDERVWPRAGRLERAAPELTVEVLAGGVEVIDRLAHEWRVLCSEGPCAEPFYRPEWVAAYLRAFEPDAKLVVVIARADGCLRGVLPLVRERGTINGVPARKLRSAANSHSCQFDLVHGVRDAAEVADLIWRALRDVPGWDVIELRDAPSDGATSLLLEAARRDEHLVGAWRRSPMPYLALPAADGGPERALAHLSSRHRRMLRGNRRKLEDLGPLTFTRAPGPDRATLDRFYELEGAGWKGEQGSAIACAPERRRFYDVLARTEGLRDAVTIYTLTCGGEPVAMQYGLTQGGTFFGLKAAYDERFARFSPGQLLLEDVTLDLYSRGLRVFDFMGESDDLKSRWCTAERALASYFVFHRRPTGLLLHFWKFRVLTAARRLKHRLRRPAT